MPLPQTNDKLFERKSGGGWMMLFGLPFAIVGIVIMLSPLTGANDDLSAFFAIPFGGIFAAVGCGIILGRAGLTIDKTLGTATSWWGLLRPMKSKNYRIQDFEHISVSSEVRRSKNSTYTIYPVRIAGKGIDKLQLSAHRSEEKARQEAEDIAKFLELSIHDTSAGVLRIRESDTVDESLKDQFKKGSLKNEVPDPPTQMKSHVNYDGLSLSVEIPPVGFTPKLGIMLAVLVGMELLILLAFILPATREVDSSDSFNFIFIAPFALFALVPAAIVCKLLGNALAGKQSVQVSTAGLTLTKHWPLKRSVHQTADSIEEMYLIHGSTRTRNKTLSQSIGSKTAIVTRSDEKQIVFGHGLQKDESEYIMALIKGILVS